MTIRALVTGATGFIGRHLVAGLRAREVEVRAAIRSAGDRGRLAAGVDGVIIGSIDAGTDWSAALDGVDVVYHLAGVAHQLGLAGQREATHYAKVNTSGTRSLARQCAASASVSRLVFMSSIAAAAVDRADGAIAETPYGRSKRDAEDAIRVILADGRPDFTIVRPALVYGPGNPGNMQRLLRLTRFPVPLPLGGIHNRRSFMFVDNLVDLLARVGHDTRASRQTFEVADEEAVSTPELIRMIGRVSGRSVWLVAVPEGVLRWVGRFGDSLAILLRRRIAFDTYSVDRLAGSLVVDSRPVQERLAWRPPLSLEEGLLRTLARDK